jgi:hypothetical protein
MSRIKALPIGLGKRDFHTGNCGDYDGLICERCRKALEIEDWLRRSKLRF